MSDIIDLFHQTLANLKVSDAEQIKSRRDILTKVLNKEFRDLDSNKSHRIMVGSWGRHTSINGVSDLDMIYILPSSLKAEYLGKKGYLEVLERTKKAISARYPRTKIKLDRLVVVVQFQNYKFEIQPCFENSDGSFSYPDKSDESWKRTDPRSEIAAMQEINNNTRGSARALCRLTRAWKRKHDVAINGLLIDTLVWKFLSSTENYRTAGSRFDQLSLDFFTFLSELPDQDYWRAPGSNQHVYVEKRFQRKAKKAVELCQDAIDAEGKSTMYSNWRKVFGKFVPSDASSKQLDQTEAYKDTEEFIEDYFKVALSYHLKIDCTVTQDGFRPTLLSIMALRNIFLRPQKQLEFTVSETNVPEPFELLWKILNRGEEAERRDQIRGQIIRENNSRTHKETTLFQGDHYVECYAIKDGVVVARAHLDVPIRPVNQH